MRVSLPQGDSELKGAKLDVILARPRYGFVRKRSPPRRLVAKYSQVTFLGTSDYVYMHMQCHIVLL